MIWVYAIQPADADPPEQARGLHAAPLWSVAAGDVAAIASTHAADAVDSHSRQALLEHATVVEACHRVAPVLPVRFGTTHSSEDALRGVLQAEHEMLLGALRRVAGHVEFGLRVAPPAGASAPTASAQSPRAATSGRGYMECLAAHQRAEDGRTEAATRAVSAIDEVVGEHTADRFVSSAPPSALLASIAYLVPSERAPAFEEAVASLPRRCSADVTCTGPWPPYSFAPPEKD